MSEDNIGSKRQKVHLARSFAKSAMACPGCHATLRDPVDQCPYCGFTGQDSMSHFPFEAPAMTRFIDPSGHLTEGDRDEVGRILADLARKFPQPRFCFCIIDLIEEADPREFGFWLLNASPVDDPQKSKLRPWTILLVIDDANGRASVTPGYAIEPFLNDEAWISLFRSESQYFFLRDYLAAITRFLEGAEVILTEGAARTEKALKLMKAEKPRGGLRRKRIERRFE
jgi:hypothetical protein